MGFIQLETDGFVVECLKTWARDRMPRLNNEALQGQLAYETFGEIARREVLSDLPAIENIDHDDIRPMLTILGMIGSSTERHAQQQALIHARSTGDTNHVSEQGHGLDLLLINNEIPFLDYYSRLADKIGHSPRDSLYSLVMWNGPKITVYHPHDQSIILQCDPQFDDGTFLTFSGEPIERSFMQLVKETVVLQEAANLFLTKLVEERSELQSVESQHNATISAQLFWSIRACMHRFMKLPNLDVDFFLDVVRQYECVWYPPETRLRQISVANDVHSLYKDLILFDQLIPPTPHFPGYNDYVKQIYCVLLPPHITQLETALATPTLQTRLTQALQNNPNPAWIWPYVDLYNAQRDMSRTHYGLVARFLLQPQKKRAANGDTRNEIAIVDNNHGTTGMDPVKIIKYLDDARAAHPLTHFNQLQDRPKPVRLSHKQLLNLVEIG